MPIYEYECNACGHKLEAFQKMSEAPITECPVCHQSTMQKLVSAAGFQLKGTGWYATDFRNKGKPDAKQEKNETSQSDKSDSTKGKEEQSSSGSTTKGKEDKSSSGSTTKGEA